MSNVKQMLAHKKQLERYLEDVTNQRKRTKMIIEHNKASGREYQKSLLHLSRLNCTIESTKYEIDKIKKLINKEERL